MARKHIGVVPFKMDKRNWYYIDYRNKYKQFEVDELRSCFLRPETVMHLLPDQIDNTQLSADQKIRLLIDQFCLFKDGARLHFDIYKGTLEILEHQDTTPGKGKLVDSSQCSFTPLTLKNPHKLFRLDWDRAPYNRFPDNIKGIKINEFHKDELFINGSVEITPSLSINIVHDFYLVWADNSIPIKDGDSKFYPYLKETDVSFSPIHVLHPLPKNASIQVAGLKNTPVAAVLEEMENGTRNDNIPIFNYQDYLIKVPDIIYGHPLTIIDKTNLLVFGTYDLPNGAAIKVDISNDYFLYAINDLTNINSVHDYIVDTKHCQFLQRELHKENDVFRFPVEHELYKVLKIVEKYQLPTEVPDLLLEKFPDTINGNSISREEKINILFPLYKEDSRERKLILHPNSGLLFYNSKGSPPNGTQLHNSKIITTKDCVFVGRSLSTTESKILHIPKKKGNEPELGF